MVGYNTILTTLNMSHKCLSVTGIYSTKVPLETNKAVTGVGRVSYYFSSVIVHSCNYLFDVLN